MEGQGFIENGYEGWEETQGRLPSTNLNVIRRSFTVGTGIVAAGSQGGQALRIQTLDPVLVSGVYQQNDAKMMQVIMSQGTLGGGAVAQEFSNIEGYGNDLDAFFAEDGDSITEDNAKVAVADSVYTRYVKNVRIMVTRRQVSILSAKAATLVEPMAIETANAALDMIGKANGYIYNANSLVANTQWEGLWQQHWQWATNVDPATTYIPKSALRVADWPILRQRLNPFLDVRNLGFSADLLNQSGQKTTEAMFTAITADAGQRFGEPGIWIGRKKTIGALIGSTSDRMRYVDSDNSDIGRPIMRLMSGDSTAVGVVGDALYTGSPISPLGNNGQAYESGTATDWATAAGSGNYAIKQFGTSTAFAVYDESFANSLGVSLLRHDGAGTNVGFSVTAVTAGGGDDTTNINPLVYGTLNNFLPAGTVTASATDDPSTSTNGPFGNLTSTPANYVGKYVDAGVGNREYAIQLVNRKGEVSELIKVDNADASAAGKANVLSMKFVFSSTLTASHLKNLRIRVFSRTEASSAAFRYLADIAMIKYGAGTANTAYAIFLDNGLFQPGNQHSYLLTMSKGGQWNVRFLMLGFFPRQLAPTTRSDNFAYLLMGTPIVRVPSWNTIITGITN